MTSVFVWLFLLIELIVETFALPADLQTAARIARVFV
jgi:hypothetical protein